MSRVAPNASGGTFCRFTVGSPAPGASVRYLRYIANEASVRDREQGMLLWNLPQREAPSVSYEVMTCALADYAKADARWEQEHHKSRGQPRTHYRALLSFEADKGTTRANGLVVQWLAAVFPKARAASFLHRNAGHLHAHVWIAARQTDGKKINLSARSFRQLDERWNGLYSEALGRPEQEHLTKKWQTEGYKLLRREGHDVTRPTRVAHEWRPEMFTERERERLGVGRYERDESGTGAYQRGLAGDDPRTAAREQDAESRQGEAERSVDYLDRANRSVEHAVSEAHNLHTAATRVAEREREVNTVNQELGREREW